MIASLVADFVADFVANFFATTFLTLAVPFQPHAAVKPSTISRWIIATLDLAGIDTSTFRGHSVRGAAASDMAKHGSSIAAIMERGNWSSVRTVERFYKR